MTCVSQLLSAAVSRLKTAGSDEPEANAEWLLAYALGVSRTWVLANGFENVPAEKQIQFESFLVRKERGEPLSHIVGFQPFCGLDIRVTPDVLTPRPETEDLGSIIRAVTVKKVFIGDTPRLMDASSMNGSI